MDIKGKAKLGGTLICGALLLAIAGSGYQINQIRLGGPLAERNQLASDLLADILPPPEYLIESYLEATMLINEPASLSARKANLAKLEEEFESRYAYWQQAPLDSDLKQMLLEQSGGDAKRFWSELDGKMLPALQRQDQAAARESYNRLSQLYATHRKHVDELVAKATTLQGELARKSSRVLGTTIILLAVLSIAIFTMLVGSVVYLLRKALQPIGQTAQVMRRMAEGELDLPLEGGERADEIGVMVQSVEVFRAAAKAQRANGENQKIVVTALADGLEKLADGNLAFRLRTRLPDEYRALGESFNATMQSLAETLGRVASSVSTVETGASEIRSASDDLSRRTEQQAASLEETAAAMDEITATVREAAEGALQANNEVEEARLDARQSGEVVQRAVEAMAGIERASSEISEIISVMDGISFQTNLLALNAGVEAARAGDAGKGFAVVASEVRALAQRSADAAKDVKTRIIASSDQVGLGVELVTETGKALERITGRILRISELVSAIATSSEQQAAGLSQINTAVAEMDGVTQQNAAMVEQATAAARSLASEAQSLRAEVARFRLAGDNSADATLAVHHPHKLPVRTAPKVVRAA